jgi:GT2 family glycosyltransferase
MKSHAVKNAPAARPTAQDQSADTLEPAERGPGPAGLGDIDQPNILRLKEQLQRVRLELQRQVQIAETAKREAARVQKRLDEVLASTSWRVTGPLRHVVARLRHWQYRSSPAHGSPATYESWIERFDYNAARDRSAYEANLASLIEQPLISVVMPVYNTEAGHLDAAIWSVRQQIYPNWELCICDDASTKPETLAVLARHAAEEPRIKVARREVNGHISEATNTAFELAKGEYIALLDHDDVLREHALAEVANVLNDHPRAQIVYSDEDKIDDAGRRFDPFFKPDFSPDLFVSQNYINHLTVHRADNIRRVGGWRKGFEGSQDYDLSLRILAGLDGQAVVHIRKVLYHWRATAGSTASSGSEKNYAYEAGLKALREHVGGKRPGARVEPIEGLPYYRVVHAVPDPEPLVSLIVPTKDHAEVLRLCLDSILTKTDYPNFEVLVVDNNSTEAATFALLEAIERDRRVRVLRYPHPFNYSAINNFAAGEAKGSVLGLINNDIEVITPSWLTEMVSHASRPEVGCVGAKLYYPNDTVQHAGIILGIGGVAGHSHKYYPRSSFGYFSRLRVCQNISAVTGACLVVRRQIFDEVAGFDAENLAVAFNDVDFCLRVRERGYLNVFTPFAELYHHESISRGTDEAPQKQQRFRREVMYMLERWHRELQHDPYYSPALTLEHENFELRQR